ncbi:hypothetical protein FS749_004419 [Ceratobasidium sp. UAMH 11750]|nr:hypothetical protein FS749_004419 [Ceratobasidium sp. UAMH 11750]
MPAFQFKSQAMLRLSPGECSNGINFFYNLWKAQHKQHNRLPTMSNTVATSILERHFDYPRDIDYSCSWGGDLYYLSYDAGAALCDAVKSVYYLAGDIATSCRWMNVEWDPANPFGLPNIFLQLEAKGCWPLPDSTYPITHRSAYVNPFPSVGEAQQFAHHTQFWVICMTQCLRLWAVHERVIGLEKYFVTDFSESLGLEQAVCRNEFLTALNVINPVGEYTPEVPMPGPGIHYAASYSSVGSDISSHNPSSGYTSLPSLLSDVSNVPLVPSNSLASFSGESSPGYAPIRTAYSADSESAPPSLRRHGLPPAPIYVPPPPPAHIFNIELEEGEIPEVGQMASLASPSEGPVASEEDDDRIAFDPFTWQTNSLPGKHEYLRQWADVTDTQIWQRPALYIPASAPASLQKSTFTSSGSSSDVVVHSPSPPPTVPLLDPIDKDGDVSIELDNDLQQILQVSQNPDLTRTLTNLIPVKYGVLDIHV